jgi:hypothetical protein
VSSPAQIVGSISRQGDCESLLFHRSLADALELTVEGASAPWLKSRATSRQDSGRRTANTRDSAR